jgi:serine/threonine protein kinase
VVVSSAPGSVICQKCRLEYPGEALFCPNCGTARARDESGDPMLGTTIGDRYLLIERIGQGASGTIYQAEHITLRRKVAVKVLHHELSRDDLAIERFRREATTVGQIENDHIVEIFDFGRTGDGRLYLAMELLEGETLADLMDRERPVPVDNAVDILIQVGEALMEAHAMGYVHRDLRPRNIFLALRRGKGGKPFVKLLDFGLAKLVEKEGEAASTSLGMTFGDPHYMSPEQARGDSIDRRADIYSLGCIAYQMLVGDPPFSGGKVFDILTRHVDQTPADAAVRRPELPTWLSRAVMRMLAKRPDERFITVFRVIEALRQGSASGLIMPDEVARRHESTPPPSVSQAMAKLSQRSATDIEEPAAPPAPQPVPAPAVAPAPVPAPAPAVAASGKGASPITPIVGGRTVLGVGAAGGMSVAEVVARAGASSGSPSAIGKNLMRGNAPASSTAVSGLSAAWFADGDAMEDGSDLDESVRRRLEQARSRTRASSGTGAIASAEYARETRRRWKLAAVVGVVVVLLAAGALALTSGGDDEEDAASGTPAAKKSEGGEGDKAKEVAAASAPTPVPTPPPETATPTPPAPEPVVAKPAPVTEPPVVEEKKPAVAEKKPAVKTTASKGKAPASKTSKTAKSSKKPGRFDSIGAEPIDPYAGGEGEGDQPAPEPKSEPDKKPSGKPDAGKADFYAKLGDRDLANGDFLGAATNFNKARELDANNLTAIIGLGEIALSQGSTSAAIAHLKKATKLKSSSARAHTLLGEAYLSAGQKSNAAASFKKALKIDSDNARARDGYNEATGANQPDPDALE